MTSKYSIAKDMIEACNSAASDAGIDPGDVKEALLISVIAALKEERDADNLRSLLQYEVDSLGSGGVHEIQRR